MWLDGCEDFRTLEGLLLQAVVQRGLLSFSAAEVVDA